MIRIAISTALLPLIVIFNANSKGYSYQIEFENTYELRTGVNINFYGLQPRTHPSITIFMSTIIHAYQREPYKGKVIIRDEDESFSLIGNYALTLSIYNKTVGNNTNRLFSDIQMDLVNTFSAGVGGKTIDYFKYSRTINNSQNYNIKHNMDRAVIFSTNFLINNYRRNQTLSSLNITLNDITVNYYNDGGGLMSRLGLSDGFDRWWTGGGGVVKHTNDGFNEIEFYFKQFTGYSPLAYELSKVLGVDVPNYEIINNSLYTDGHVTITPSSYNNSLVGVSYFLSNQVGFNAGLSGNLKKRNYWGIQDIIHIVRKFPLHPNNESTRGFMGLNSNFILNEDSFE